MPASLLSSAQADVQLDNKKASLMDTVHPEDRSRRDFLFISTGAVAAVAAGAAVWPFVAQMNPDTSTISAASPIEVDVAPIARGQSIKVFWRGAPIFINHRTEHEIASAREIDWKTMIDPQSDEARTKPGHEQWLVVKGVCTHLGCIPNAHEGEFDGWFCHCHGSQYDSSGRVRRGPAPLNLELVPYQFVSDTKLLIGAA
jgi:ubiquinol-cytochrome c reductase iron-sulfur subunit